MGRPQDEVREEAMAALSHIPDPELGVSIVDLGLVYDVTVDTEGTASVTYTLTTPGCGIGPMLEGQMLEVLFTVPEITDVRATLVFDPPWTRDRMSPEVRALVGDRAFEPPVTESPLLQIGREES